MGLRQDYKGHALGNKESAVTQRHFVEEIPPERAIIHRNPWDSEETMKWRTETAGDLAEDLLDLDIGKRASLYSQLPDDRLEHYASQSIRLLDMRRQSLLLGIMSVSMGGIAGTMGLSTGFNTVNIAAGGFALLATGVAFARSRLAERDRMTLTDCLDRELDAREIRPITKPFPVYR